MNTKQEIRAKRHELDQLRQSVGSTLRQPTSGHGMAIGIVAAGFAAGFIVERSGVRPAAAKAMSLNRMLTMAAPMITPAITLLQQHYLAE